MAVYTSFVDHCQATHRQLLDTVCRLKFSKVRLEERSVTSDGKVNAWTAIFRIACATRRLTTEPFRTCSINSSCKETGVDHMSPVHPLLQSCLWIDPFCVIKGPHPAMRTRMTKSKAVGTGVHVYIMVLVVLVFLGHSRNILSIVRTCTTIHTMDKQQKVVHVLN